MKGAFGHGFLYIFSTYIYQTRTFYQESDLIIWNFCRSLMSMIPLR